MIFLFPEDTLAVVLLPSSYVDLSLRCVIFPSNIISFLLAESGLSLLVCLESCIAKRKVFVNQRYCGYFRHPKKLPRSSTRMQLGAGHFGGPQGLMNPAIGPGGAPAGPHGVPPPGAGPPAPAAGVSSLPLPPTQYIAMFTDENVKRGKVPAPPPIIRDAYSVFAGEW